MKRWTLATALVTCLAGTPALADTLLASFDHTGTGVFQGLPVFEPFLSYGDPSDPGSIYLSATLTLVDILNGIDHDLSGAPGAFDAFAALASDGVNQPLYVGLNMVNGTGSQLLTTESSLYSSGFLAPGVNLPDFSGYRLTRIVILGSSFQQNGDTLEMGTNFQVYGDPVPEPATVVLLALACGALAPLRKKLRNN